jgi:hypothetical protein
LAVAAHREGATGMRLTTGQLNASESCQVQRQRERDLRRGTARLLAGVAIVGTSRPEAEAVLSVIDEWTPERLRGVAASLREFIDRAA